MLSETRVLSYVRTPYGTYVTYQYKKTHGPCCTEVCLGLCNVLDAKYRSIKLLGCMLNPENMTSYEHLRLIRDINAKVRAELDNIVIGNNKVVTPDLYAYHVIKKFAHELDSLDPTLDEYPEFALSNGGISNFEVGVLTNIFPFEYELYNVYKSHDQMLVIPIIR